MAPAPVLMMPCCAVLDYKQRDKWHTLLLGFALGGKTRVGLRIHEAEGRRSTWSGWHGGWSWIADRVLTPSTVAMAPVLKVNVHWRGKHPHRPMLLRLRLRPDRCSWSCVPAVGDWFRWGSVWIRFRGLRSCVIQQRQITAPRPMLLLLRPGAKNEPNEQDLPDLTIGWVLV